MMTFHGFHVFEKSWIFQNPGFSSKTPGILTDPTISAGVEASGIYIYIYTCMYVCIYIYIYIISIVIEYD